MQWLLLLMPLPDAAGQTVSLALSSGTAAADGSAAVDLALTSSTGYQPVSVQWSLTYSTSTLSSISVAPGSAITAAGKSLSCNPTTGKVTCVAYGMNRSLIANGTVAVVNVKVPSGVTSANLGVSSTFASSDTGIQLVSSGSGGAILGLSPVLPSLSTLACSPATVTSPTTSTCTVTLTAAAPSGGVTVSLSSNNANLTVPTSVVVPRGATSVTFAATPAMVSSSLTVTVMASAGGVGKTAMVTVAPAAQLSSLSCSPATVNAPGTSTCTVTLTQAAPTTGLVVTLASNNANVAVPSSATVSSGATTRTFTATVALVTTDQTATVAASAAGVSKTFALNASAPAQLSSVACSPSSLVPSQMTTCTVRLTKAATNAVTVGLSSNNTALPVGASMTVPSGATTGTFTATATTVASSQTVTLTARLGGVSKATPVTVAPVAQVSSLSCSPATVNAPGTSTCTVTLTQAAPASGFAVTLASNNENVTVPSSVTVASGATTRTFQATVASLATNQTATLTASAAGVSRTFTLNISAPAQVSAVACSPSSITSGQTTNCNVTLTKAASGGGFLVTLSSSSAALVVPATVSVASGSKTATFTGTSKAVSGLQTVTITASAGAAKSTTVRVAPDTQVPTAPSGLTARGEAGLISLSWTASNDNVRVTSYRLERCQGAGCTTFAQVGTPISTTYTDTGLPASTSYSYRVRAVDAAGNLSAYSNTATATTQAAAQLSALSCSPATVSAPGTLTCTVTLTLGAPAGGLAVALASSTTTVAVPASVTVASGTTSQAFTATVASVTASQTVVLTASAGGVSKTFTLSVSPSANCPCSLWNNAVDPNIGITQDTQATEAGLKFTSKIDGYVTGVRFYKGAANTGVHVGHLWSKGGTLLASVNFANETATGWQQAFFSTPVAITANTVYVISYRAPNGHYSKTVSYFASKGLDNGPLHALAEGESGSNGVYKYGNGNNAFPDTGSNSTNYWVDVVFDTTSATTSSTTSAGAKRLSYSAGQTATATATSRAAHSLLCSPKVVRAGESFTCQLDLRDDTGTDIRTFALDSSGSDVLYPAVIRAGAGQKRVSFRADVEATASQTSVTMFAGEGADQVEDSVTILPGAVPVVSVPETLNVRSGEPVGFVVSAEDPARRGTALLASRMPAGASFEAASGEFVWTPPAQPEGDYEISFAATNGANQSAAARVRVSVSSGQPLSQPAPDTACSPGAIGVLNGKWLTLEEDPFAAPAGGLQELGGTRLSANGQKLAIVYVERGRLDFICPSLAPGQSLAITVETAAGSAPPVRIPVLEVTPRLLEAVSTQPHQGLITLGDSDRLATVRDYTGAGEPARPGDLVTLRATGLGPNAASIGQVFVKVDGNSMDVVSVTAAPDAAGVYLVRFRMPAAVSTSSAVPVQLEVAGAGGGRSASNTVTLAVEQDN